MSNLFQKAIVFSMARFGLAEPSHIIDGLREDRTAAELHRLGVARLHAALLSLGGMNRSPEWAATTALTLNHYMQDHTAVDPTDGQWRRTGFAIPMEVNGEAYGAQVPLAVAIPGTDAILMCLEERERVLPAVSIARETTKRVAEFQKREERQATKKDWAMIKDDVTQRMLKTAPIRPKFIPIMITRGQAFFFTTSVKASDDAGTFLRSVFGTWPMAPIFDFTKLQSFLSDTLWGDLAIPHDEMCAEEGDALRFYPTDAAKLEDHDDSTHALTKQDLVDKTGIAQSLADRWTDITIKELAFDYYPKGLDINDVTRGARLHIKMGSNGVFKKIASPELSIDLVERTMDALPDNRLLGEDEHIARSAAGFWLMQQTFHDLMLSMRAAGAVNAQEMGLPYWVDTATPEYIQAEQTMAMLVELGEEGVSMSLSEVEHLLAQLTPLPDGGEDADLDDLDGAFDMDDEEDL